MEEIREHVLPVAAGLAEVHAAGLLHRDIKPGNIVIRADGAPVLIDFGSARHEASAKSRSLTAVITPGYAPLEQYSSSLGDQRPTADIYALGAVLYRCVTGDSPPDATDRALEDGLTPAAQVADGTYSPGLLTAIDAALRMSPDERPRNTAAFLQLMSFGDTRRARPEDTEAGYSEAAIGARLGSESGRTGRNPAHSNRAGSHAIARKPIDRALLEATAMIGGVIIVVVAALTIFFGPLGGEQRPSSASNLAPVPSTVQAPPPAPRSTASVEEVRRYLFARSNLLLYVFSGAEDERGNTDTGSALLALMRGDFDFAQRAFDRLAEQGRSSAQFMLGSMYDFGQGVRENDAQAAQWYTRAAEQGHSGAQFMLGLMYASGEGVPENHSQAMHWYIRAAEQGLAEAQVRLSFIYADGEGVPRDDVQAYAWADLASAQGHERAANQRDLIGERLLAQGSGLFSEAQELSRELKGRIGISR